MPGNPLDLERARDRLTQISALRNIAVQRAAAVPRIESDAWRGSAYEMYSWRVELLTSRLHAAAGELGEAVTLARAELLDVAG